MKNLIHQILWYTGIKIKDLTERIEISSRTGFFNYSLLFYGFKKKNDDWPTMRRNCLADAAEAACNSGSIASYPWIKRVYIVGTYKVNGIH